MARTVQAQEQKRSEGISVVQYGKNMVVLLDRVDMTVQHNKSCFYLRKLCVCVIRNKPPQHHAEPKASFPAIQ